MNRNEEYQALLDELSETPLKLEYTVERALARRSAQKRRHRKAVFAPIISLTAVFAVFILLVNISPPFAYAAGRIPLIRDLAQFVALSPSLSAAVENEYVQPIGQEQTVNGITARIEYVIVDQKQLNIFFTLKSDNYDNLTEEPLIEGVDGSLLNGFSISYASPDEKNDGLRKITVDFSSGIMPEALVLKLNAQTVDSPIEYIAAPPTEYSYENSFFENQYTPKRTVAEFSFSLSFDPSFTTAGDLINLNQSFEIDGQTLFLNSVGIYPTQTRFVFEDSQSNTAWMTGLSFYVENERGERFDNVSNGVSAFGKEDSPMKQQFMLESPFFSKSKHLTLYITGVTWLDKSMEKVHVDLKNKTADALPEGVEFVSSEKHYSDWLLTFSAPEPKSGGSSQIWSMTYYDPNGTELSLNSMSFTTSGEPHNSGTAQQDVDERRNEEWFALKDYPYDEVWLCPSFSRRVTLDEPISIEIK